MASKIGHLILLLSLELLHCIDFKAKYGYLEKNTLSKINFKDAIRSFQIMSSLPVTGQIDKATTNMMEKPRCGFTDSITYGGRKWNHHHLTYKYLKFTKDLPENLTREIIEEAFRVWSEVTPLTFEEVPESKRSNLEIGFYSRGHGDGFPFDGPSRVLAHAFLPRDGTIHFDDSEEWVDGPSSDEIRNRINLFVVAAHEIGHALGLSHLKDKKALMYPYHVDILHRHSYKLPDVDRKYIQSIYGDKKGIIPGTGTGSGSGSGSGTGSGLGSGSGSGAGKGCGDFLPNNGCERASIFSCLTSYKVKTNCRKHCGLC